MKGKKEMNKKSNKPFIDGFNHAFDSGRYRGRVETALIFVLFNIVVFVFKLFR
jgi:hypothetical protein